MVGKSMSVDLVSQQGNTDSFLLEERTSTGGSCSHVTKNKEGTGNISSFDNKEKLAPDNSTTAREFCIYVLKSSGLLPSAIPSDIHTSQNLPISDVKLLPCSICDILSNPHTMMICDLCDKAFHLICCGEKEPFSEDWFCLTCLKKRPIPLLDTAVANLLAKMEEVSRKRILRCELGPFLAMLGGFDEYASKVRIGNSFQAEVPEWTGPINETDEYFSEPVVLDPTDWSAQDGWRFTKPLNPASYSNWIQCRVGKYFNDDAEVRCGKWRRAPFHVTQTDNWDCSCSVVWDPFHADCAVPQEVETEEVLKQLKYVEQVKLQLNKKRKTRLSGSLYK